MSLTNRLSLVFRFLIKPLLFVCWLNAISINSQTNDAQVANIQCALEYNLNVQLFSSECSTENSCILADLKSDTFATYEVNRTQIHEFKCLIFVDSYIMKIPSNIFITAKSKISHLYANNVSISELSRNSFLIVNQLESVDLSWNELEKLHETAFYDASHLKTLNLSHNKISDFSLNVFDKLDNLRTLDLSYNQISSIPFDIFQPLYNLKELNLRNNRLQLKFGIFPETLQLLDLSYNNLEIQQKFKIFALMESLTTLLLHGKVILLYQYFHIILKIFNDKRILLPFFFHNR